MRPRGLSASSPVGRNVGHACRQKPQWTQASSAAKPPRSLIACDCRDEDAVRIERLAQPGDERSHTLAVGAEVPHSAAQLPRRALEGQRDLEGTQGAPHPPQPARSAFAPPPPPPPPPP